MHEQRTVPIPTLIPTLMLYISAGLEKLLGQHKEVCSSPQRERGRVEFWVGFLFLFPLESLLRVQGYRRAW